MAVRQTDTSPLDQGEYAEATNAPDSSPGRQQAIRYDGSVLSVCIYCKRSPPDVTPSEAHIFPYSFGGTESCEDTVCEGCNGRINRDIETPLFSSFRVLLSLFGIEGRRGRVPGVPARVKVEGHDAPVYLGADGRPKGPVIRVDADDRGKKAYFVYGPDEMVQAFMDDINRSRPDVKWSQSKYEASIEIVADAPSVDDPFVRRLAAKIAFERFAQLRGDVIAADPEFDIIREFILTGAEPQPCCGMTADPLLLKKSFNFRVPTHAVVVVFHEADRILGSFVMLFGLFLYWVILSRRYRALGSVDDLLVEWPHVREAQRPVLRSGLGAIRVPWHNYIGEYTRDPLAAARDANRAARLKLQAVVDEAYSENPDAD